MFLTPYTHVEWAYQLHYHLCFRTHRRREFFKTGTEKLSDTLNQLYTLHGYHGLEMKLRAADVQLLLSLKPEHAISDVLKKIKGESSALLCASMEIEPPLWARGYLARTSGKVRSAAVKSYLEKQAQHHGYDLRPLPPVFRFRNFDPPQFSVAHAVFDLKYHLVVATKFRQCIFDSRLGGALVEYWLKVAEKREFALDQATVLPDHVHMVVRTTPKMSIGECGLLLMNNGQYFVGKYWPSRLIQAGIDQLWQPSGYAGSCGELPTALLKSFLAS
ncbi:MAG TPA: IS200/IS605 family transposase [Pyrinomonadaceae bacterium]|nr:IS200/IS605 family transposase [Pyrinomonadaceae bacterium]